MSDDFRRLGRSAHAYPAAPPRASGPIGAPDSATEPMLLRARDDAVHAKRDSKCPGCANSFRVTSGTMQIYHCRAMGGSRVTVTVTDCEAFLARPKLAGTSPDTSGP